MKLNLDHDLFYAFSLLSDTDGIAEHIWWDFPQITMKSVFNKGGMITVLAPESHEIVSLATRDRIFELSLSSRVRHQGAGVLTSRSMALGLYRDSQIVSDENGNIFHMMYFFHPIEVLERYVSGYPTGILGKSKFINREMGYLANDLIRWNCTEEATAANGRIRDADRVRSFHDFGGIGGTPAVDLDVNPGTPIIDIIRELSRLAPFNFTVAISNFISPAGLVSFITDITNDSFGEDKSDEVYFALELDNVRRINMSGDSLSEKTVAIVGGQGEGASRVFEVVTGHNYHSPTNSKEMWINASSDPDDALQTIGETQLARLAAKNRYAADIASSHSWIPFLDYGVGDLVTVIAGSNADVQRISALELSWDSSQKTTVAVEFEAFSF